MLQGNDGSRYGWREEYIMSIFVVMSVALLLGLMTACDPHTVNPIRSRGYNIGAYYFLRLADCVAMAADQGQRLSEAPARLLPGRRTSKLPNGI